MPQRTLQAYFQFPARPPPSVNGPSFLDLPYSVRHRVYVLAWLVRSCPIDLNREGERKLNPDETLPSSLAIRGKCYYLNRKFLNLPSKWYEDDVDCVCPPLPIQLLYVSRTISKECSHILYRENKFKICRSRHGGFLPLHYMAGPTLESITSLSIRLNACLCRPKHKHRDQRQCNCHQTCKGGTCGRDKPLGTVSRNDKSAILDWNSVCAKISSNIHPSYLRLFVVCDTTNYEVAMEVIEPLLKMPTLRACSIRLGQTPNHELRRLAQTIALQATGKFSSTLTSRYCYFHLPAEIRQKILGYTGLVAPHAVLWERNHGTIIGDCCGNCTDTLEACCCSVQHAAFAENCTCWKMPTELFLLCHSLRIEATKIFYRRNHFVILPAGVEFTLVDAQPSVLEFLVSLPSQALEHLRSIECVFANLSPNFLNPGSKGHSHWLRTIAFICDHLQLSTLSLTLNMSSDRGPSSDCAYMSLQQILDTEDAMWATYQRIIGPLTRAPLNLGLKNLFIHLSWPVDDAKLHIRDAQERALERRIMGEGYDALSQGKFAAGRYWDNEP
jgi:hypothetical protein